MTPQIAKWAMLHNNIKALNANIFMYLEFFVVTGLKTNG